MKKVAVSVEEKPKPIVCSVGYRRPYDGEVFRCERTDEHTGAICEGHMHCASGIGVWSNANNNAVQLGKACSWGFRRLDGSIARCNRTDEHTGYQENGQRHRCGNSEWSNANIDAVEVDPEGPKKCPWSHALSGACVRTDIHNGTSAWRWHRAADGVHFNNHDRDAREDASSVEPTVGPVAPPHEDLWAEAAKQGGRVPPPARKVDALVECIQRRGYDKERQQTGSFTETTSYVDVRYKGDQGVGRCVKCGSNVGCPHPRPHTTPEEHVQKQHSTVADYKRSG